MNNTYGILPDGKIAAVAIIVDDGTGKFKVLRAERAIQVSYDVEQEYDDIYDLGGNIPVRSFARTTKMTVVLQFLLDDNGNFLTYEER